ncbi:hypothetical protein B4110_0039 [Parageobacillus toebii]|uniref:Uncharacterized protein n=1 Tax=Parageobacillus toebii TaxID=153151 RepID=A0A150N6X5_9BACL|nr:hypothetical protein B4110_0039 [Parageobacillus toebii]
MTEEERSSTIKITKKQKMPIHPLSMRCLEAGPSRQKR